MRKIQVFLPEPVIAELRKLSDDRDVSVSELARRAVEMWLEQQRKSATNPVNREE